MREYIQLLTEIFSATMAKGQYRTALQALQTLIRIHCGSNNKNNVPRLEDMDDESLMRLIEGYEER